MADPRSASAKLIRERLRLGATPPPSAHPDAELLTAFAERSLNDSERAQILEHLAYCSVCRDVVYLAQPEEEAPTQATSPAPIRWFAWRRLQWAALAASLGVIATVAFFVREHPERSVLTGATASQPASHSNAQGDENNVSVSTYATSGSGQNGQGERRESTLQAPENQERLKAEAKLADEAAHRGFNGSADFKSRDLDAFAKLPLKAPTSSTDDLSKNGRLYDKELAAKSAKTRSDAYAFSTEKDALTFTAEARPGNAADSTGLFDLRQQQKVQSGPSASLNFQNNTQNAATNGMYVDRSAQAANTPAAAPSLPPPPALATKTDSGYSVKQTAEKQQGTVFGGAAAGGPVAMARPAAPTRSVVPAEEARNKKKLETIPAHATPPGTEETVAVAGKAPDVEPSHAETPGTVNQTVAANLPSNGRDISALLTIVPALAPRSAITDWRVRHGRFEERLYGSWHNMVLRKQPMIGADGSVTASASSNASSNLVEMSQSGNPVHSVSAESLVPQQRFTAVTHLGADVWLVEIAGKSQIVVHHSHDAGVTWQPSTFVVQGILNPSTQTAIKFKDTQQGEITLSSGERWQTTDGGAHWNLVK